MLETLELAQRDGKGGAGEDTGSGQQRGSDGLTSSITGSAVKRAGGGNGGDNLSGNNNFGGGNGNADGGDTNKGGGAGGGKSGVNGGVGGSGIVILRFPNTGFDKYWIWII